MLIDKIKGFRNVLFLIALTIEVALVIIDKSRLTNPWTSYCFRVTFVLFFICMILSEYTRSAWLMIALGILLGIVSYGFSGRAEILRFVVFTAACGAQPLKRTFLVMFGETLAGCLGIVVLALTGLFGEITVTQVFREAEGAVTRFSLGFGYPNALQCMFYMLLLMALYILDRYMHWYIYVSMALMNVGIYLLTGTRTGMILGFFSIALAVLMHYPRNPYENGDVVARFQRRTFGKNFIPTGLRSKRWPYVLGGLAVVLSVAFSVLSALWSIWIYTVDTPFVRALLRLDRALNGRIVNLYGNTMAHEGVISTWRIFSGREAQAYFDMGFVRLFYWYGIVPGILAVLVLLFLIYRLWKSEDGQGLMLVVSMSLYTVIEAHLVSVYIGRNFLLLLIGAYLLGEQGNGEKETRYLPELVKK